MALKISRREWDRGLPREGSLGRCCCKHSHSASERLLGYVVLMLHSLSNCGSRCIPKHALNSDRPEALTPHYFLGCSLKKRTISVEASCPFGSVKEPLELPPDQA